MKFIDINEESVPDKKDEDSPKKVTPAKHFILKELLEIFHDIEREKNKMLKATPNLERRMTAPRGTESGKLHRESARALLQLL